MQRIKYLLLFLLLPVIGLEAQGLTDLQLPAKTLRFSVRVPGEGRHDLKLRAMREVADPLTVGPVIEYEGWIRPRAHARRSPATAVYGEGELILFFRSRRKHLPVLVRGGAGAPREQVSVARPFQRPLCASGTKPSTAGASDAGESLQLSSSTQRILSLATTYDAEWFAEYGRSSNRMIRAAVLAASLIYEEQLQLRIYITSQRGARLSSSQPYTSSDAVELLEQFADERRSARNFGSSTTQHLFSGKRLDDGIAGVAYLGTICSNDSGLSFGLSERSGTALQPLILAHEIGHNLGANHDEVTLSLMSPAISANENRFSSASVGEISDFLSEEASCIPFSPTPAISLAASALRSVSPVRVSARVTPLTESLESCTVTLLAAPSSDALSTGARSLVAKVVSGVSTGESVRLRARPPSSLSRRRHIFVKTTVVCGTYSTESTAQRVRLR